MTNLDGLLASFLPLKLLDRLYGSCGARPIAVEFPAAVIFVDVSSYTAFVERLARQGQEGLERIPDLLGRSFSRCVNQICDHGGEVIYIIGDALLAYWPGDIAGLGIAVRAAADCAKTICDERRYWLEGGPDEMGPALHVGVGAGSLWAAAVGGRPAWSLLTGGDAVMDAAGAQMRTRRWQYLLSERAKIEQERAAIPQKLASRLHEWRSTSSPDAHWLSDFLPAQIRDVLSNTDASAVATGACTDRRTVAHLNNLAEIRPVTALFARIADLDLREPAALARLHALCVALQEDLRSLDGPPGELLFDDKGLSFVTVFGSRGSFHRDDALRAMDAAKAVTNTSRRLNLSASAGVATGDALFRVVGNKRRQQLLVLGAPMNRAARLLSATVADILCDAATERASRSGFYFEKRGTLQLHGIGDANAVYQPLERRAAISQRAPLIGREKELEFLKSALSEIRDEGRRLIVIVGESGIGKTRLVETFADEIKWAGIPVILARAERDDRRTSFLPWRRVLAAAVGLAADADGFAVLERIAANVKTNLSIIDRLPLLGAVLNTEILQNEATRHLEGAHRADATMRLLGDLIDALGARPLVLVLEDSQWLDSASWRLLDWILGSLSSLLLILCVRSEEVPDELKELRRRAQAVEINNAGLELNTPARFCHILDLEELSDASISRLVAHTLENAKPDDQLARLIANLAGGNPFFAEEIALTLRSEGLISVRDGVWRPIRALDGLQNFEGVERVIRERFDRLEPLVQAALKIAAVLGRSFSREALRVVLEREMHCEAVDEIIESLRAAHLVRRGANPNNYEFRHDQTRDVVYRSIPHNLRRRLHGAFAEWMESRQVPSLRSDMAILAQHFNAAENKEKAVEYAALAATNALATGAFREVKAFLEICIGHEPKQWLSSEVKRLHVMRWLRQLGEAHHGLGDLRAQGAAVAQALLLGCEPIPQSRKAVVLRLLRSAVQLGLQQIFPPSTAVPKSEVLGSWEHEVSRCLNQAAEVDFYELRFLRSFLHTIAAVVHAERTGSSNEMAQASAQLACGLGILGLRRASKHFMERAERTALALADPALHARICNLDALHNLGRCKWEMVDRRLNQAQDLCLAAGDQLSWCNAQALRFWSLYYRGDMGALEQTAQALLSRAQNSGNVQQEIWALRCKALWLLHADCSRQAVDVLRVSSSAMAESADLADRLSTSGCLALALARVGLHDQSVQAAVETLDLLQKMARPTVHSTLLGITGVTEVLLRGREAGLSRENSRWQQWEHRALDELKRFQHVFPVGSAQYGLWFGVAEWLNGDRKRALSAWRKALATARRLSLRKDETIIAAEIRRRLGHL